MRVVKRKRFGVPAGDVELKPALFPSEEIR